MEYVVKYYLRVNGPCTPCNSGPRKEIDSFNDVKKFVASYSASMPYTVVIERIVYTITGQETTDSYKFFVGDNLICTQDIRNFVKEQYRSTLGFDAPDSNRKVMLDSLHTQIKMDNTMLDTNIWKKTPPPNFVVWHYLTSKDVFVNRNLKKLYGRGKGQIPSGLVDLFNKKEK